MEKYLRHIKTSLENIEDRDVHVVIGNESCDLDSVVSALTFAYYLSQVARDDKLYVPVLSILRNQYHLHTESTFFLRQNNISDDLLTFKDEIDLLEIKNRGKLTLTLVDSNILDPKDGELEVTVTRIIDHRPLERTNTENIDVTVDMVGSCCTLVAEKLLHDDTFTLDRQVAVLLLGTILVDTVNTSVEAGKTTPRDTAVISTLRQMLTDVEGDQLYNSIQEAKNDVSDLTTVEILEKDLKILTEESLRVAMASVPMEIKVLLERPGVVEDLGVFCEKHGTQVLVILSMHVEEDSPHRELAIYSTHASYMEKINHAFKHSTDPDLHLTPLTTKFGSVITYHQGNVKASRKKILPLVKVAMKDCLQSQSDQSGNALQTDQSLNVLLGLDELDPLSSSLSQSKESETANFDLLSLGEQTRKSTAPEKSIQNILDFDDFASVSSAGKSEDNPSTSANLLNFDLLSDTPVTKTDSNLCDTNTNQNSSQNVDLLSGLDMGDFSVPKSPVKISLQPSVPTEGEGTVMVNFDLFDDLTEADIMESPLRTPDVMVSGASSGPGSAFTSQPGSGYPSVPVTPPNSFIADSSFSKLTDLPSFNSSEMVKRINERKELMRGVSNDSSDNEGGSVPFTPQNSLMDSQLDCYAKDHGLPSFNSSDMVQRIQQKRSSLAGNLDNMLDISRDSQSSSVPFTPKNSFCDSQFDTFARDDILPSFNNSDMVQRVQFKRQSLEGSMDDDSQDTPGASSLLDTLQPFTPHNSLTESGEKTGGNWTVDVSQLNKRLSETDLSSTTNPSSRADAKTVLTEETLLDFQPELKVEQNVVALDIACEMQNENKAEVANLLDLNFYDDNDPGDSKSDKTRNMDILPNFVDNQTPSNQISGNSNLNTITTNEITEAADMAAQEEAAISFTREIIEDVLDQFPNNWPANSLPSDQEVSKSGGEKTNLLLDVTGDKKGLQKIPSASGLTVETEYLSNMDPLHGNLDLIAGGQSDREVVESSIFRKISGEEPMTVRREILESSLDETVTSEESVNSYAENLSGELMQNVIQEVQTTSVNNQTILDSHSGESTAEERSSSNHVPEQNVASNVGAEIKGIRGLPEEYVEDFVKETLQKAVTSASQKSNEKMDDSDISSEELVSVDIDSDAESDENTHLTSANSQQAKVQIGFDLLKQDDSSSSGSVSGDESSTGTRNNPTGESGSTPVTGTVDPEEQSVDTEGLLQSDISSGGISSPTDSEDLLMEHKVRQIQSSTSPSSSSEASSTTTEGSYKVIQSPDLVIPAMELDVTGDNHPHGQGGAVNGESPREVTRKVSSSERQRNSVDLSPSVKRKTPSGSSKHFSISSESMTSDDEAKSDLSPLGELVSEGDTDRNKNGNAQRNDKKKISILSDFMSDSDEERVRSESEKSVSDQRNGRSEQKEYFMTTAGRISVACDGENGGTALDKVLTASDIHGSSRREVGQMIARVNGLFAQVDADLSPLHAPLPPCMDANSQQSAEGEVSRRRPDSDVMNNKAQTGKEKLQGVEYTEEWQDDGVPGIPQEDNETDTTESDDSRSRHSSNSSTSSTERKAARPNSLGEGKQKRKIAANFSILSDDVDDDIFDPTGELEWENDTPVKCPVEPLPEFSAEEEFRESKLWRGVEIGGKQYKIDLKVIEPYKKVLSHGGYYGDGLNAIIIFSGCYLPDRGRKDYQYVMDNLFMYVISTLETLVAEDYMIVYFHGATPRRQMPSFGWLKRCYQMIDRRLRKNLKSLLLVHPTLWLKTIVMMTRPFISSKFTSKLRFVRSLKELSQIIPMEYIYVPDQVQQYDDKLHVSRHSSRASPQSPPTIPSPS